MPARREQELSAHMPKSARFRFSEFTDPRIRIVAASSPIDSQVKAQLPRQAVRRAKRSGQEPFRHEAA
jgi:hypothetical protein